jgi:hypothetical protein
VQPYEDHVIGGGGITLLNASIEAIERDGEGFRVRTRQSDGSGQLVFEVDDVIAATGFTAPIRDLPALGVATVGRNALPAQTAVWESASVPGIYFAGTIQQASPGLRKHGMPSNSGGVNGHRSNGGILARHIARTHFGTAPERPVLRPADVIPLILHELTNGPELWHQKAYLARVLAPDGSGGLVDHGVAPLAFFLDRGGADAIAATIEENAQGSIYPCLYVRRAGVVTEHLLPPNPLHDFRTTENERALAELVRPLIA